MIDLNLLQQIECELGIDYTDVEGPGDFSLPFAFELDLNASNLTPGPGENQRFCYNITGEAPIGSGSEFRDLSHFVFSICPGITEDQLRNVTVFIDGVEQDVEIGDNVEIFNPPATDPPTGCPGLKFDFGLNKIGGEMTVCYELNEVFPIGPVPVCIFGASETRSGLSICGPICNGEPVDQTCPAEAFIRADVCAPVDITPFVNPGETTTFCCGSPDIDIVTPETPVTCIGTSSIRIIINQEICVRVPVEIGVTPDVQDALISNAILEENCDDCIEVNGSGGNSVIG